MILICVYFFSQGYFTNPQLLQATLSKAGILAPLLFILLQIIQVIIPIIPGGASSALGITAFGAVNGFCMKFHIKRPKNYMWCLQRVERVVKLQM